MIKKRGFSIILSVILILTSFLSHLTAFAEQASVPDNRVSGKDRVGTAVAISQKYWPNGSNTVIITFAGIINGSDNYFADTLSSVPMGSIKDAPILFLDYDGLSDVVQNELKRLKPSNIFIIGGTGVISNETAENIKGITGITPVRIGGADRYETAELVNKSTFTKSEKAYLASGINFLPVLTVASAAAKNRMPIYYADGALDEHTRLGITEMGIKTIETVGSVDDGIISELRSMGITVIMSNADSMEIASKNYISPAGVFIARNDLFADAAAGAVSAAKMGWPLLLVNSQWLSVPQAVKDYISSHRSITNAFAFGGPFAVGDSVLNDVNTLVSKNIVILPPVSDATPSPSPTPTPTPTTPANARPAATAVSISGTPTAGQTLTGTYTYSDAEGDSQGVSTFRWLSSNTLDGQYTAIQGATGETFVLTSNEQGKYIKFEVTPAAARGTSPGTAVLSGAKGPVEATVISDSTWIKKYIVDLSTIYGYFTAPNMDIKKTSDGGYIIVGTVQTNSEDVYLLKIDSNGTKQWDKSFGYGDGSRIDRGFSVLQVSGGYIIAGETMTKSNGDNVDFYVVKVNNSGEKLWEKTYGESSFLSSRHEQGRSIQPTSDGGYIIAGMVSGVWDFYLVKTDAEGNELWNGRYNRLDGPYNPSWDKGYAVKQTSDGGYIIAGETGTDIDGDNNIYVIKTDAVGVKQWDYMYVNPNGNGNIAYAVEETSGGYSIAGYSRAATHYSDICLIQLDKSGSQQQVNTYGINGENYGLGMDKTADGGYIIVGTTYTSNSTTQVYLVKTAADGSKQWEKTFGGQYDECGYAVRQTDDGGYIIAGYSNSTYGRVKVIYIIKTDSEGNVLSATQNTAPAVLNASIVGTLKVGQTLTGTYSYIDVEGDAEGASTFRWLSSSAVDGQYTPIQGATSKTFTLTSNELGKYIKFEVTPAAAAGASPGTAALSTARGPVEAGLVITPNLISGSDYSYGSRSFQITLQGGTFIVSETELLNKVSLGGVFAGQTKTSVSLMPSLNQIYVTVSWDQTMRQGTGQILIDAAATSLGKPLTLEVVVIPPLAS